MAGLTAQALALVQAASQKRQMMHNAFVGQVNTIAITADELWSFIQKTETLFAWGT